MKHRYLLGCLIAAAMIAGLSSTTASAQADKDQGTKKYAPPSLPTDELPYQPWAALKARQLRDAENTDPLLHCEPYGVPRIWGGPHPARLVQLPGEVIILYERDTAFRIIPTDGRPHPADA